ncbi:hypothetical protein, partial [Tolypothrix sp. VBCCA 56010]|uniref:hypothetical protein n=1 Tax=Tolypothrix sp. VBCCA 56010 TaxID=3137731 RepID=UPI003D7C67D9
RYSFTIEAPSGVPRNLNPKPDIYLLAGLWDDYGTIGTFATEVGIVKGYEGNPIKIGTGYEITGTVVNVKPVNCYA